MANDDDPPRLTELAAIVVGGLIVLRLLSQLGAVGDAAGDVGQDIGGFFGGLVSGGSEIVNEIFGGTADIADRFNPFTEGPIIPGQIWF